MPQMQSTYGLSGVTNQLTPNWLTNFTNWINGTPDLNSVSVWDTGNGLYLKNNPTDDFWTGMGGDINGKIIRANDINPSWKGTLSNGDTYIPKEYSNGNSAFGGLGRGLSALGDLASLAGGIYNMYMGNRAMEEMEDMNEFKKGLARANFANNAKMINNQYDSNARIAGSMAGTISNDGNTIGFSTASQRKQYTDAAKKQHVASSI